MDQEEDPHFAATVALGDDRAVVSVTGEVDMSTADAMFHTSTKDGAGAATLDLRGVTFFDSAAIHALLRLVDHFGADHLEVLPSAQVRRVLEIAGLASQPWLRAD